MKIAAFNWSWTGSLLAVTFWNYVPPHLCRVAGYPTRIVPACRVSVFDAGKRRKKGKKKKKRGGGWGEGLCQYVSKNLNMGLTHAKSEAVSIAKMQLGCVTAMLCMVLKQGY